MRHNPIERILREVKVLSGLHNHHVVGYHAAWIEFDSPAGVYDNNGDDDADSDFHKSDVNIDVSKRPPQNRFEQPFKVGALPPKPASASCVVPKTVARVNSKLYTAGAASGRPRSTSRCSTDAALAAKVDFFIRDPGTLSNSTSASVSTSSSSGASVSAASDHSGYDDDDEDEAADVVDKEMKRLLRKKDKSTHRKSGTSEERTGDSVVFTTDVHQSSAENTSKKFTAVIETSELARGKFNSKPGTNSASPPAKTAVIVHKPTTTDDSRSGAELDINSIRNAAENTPSQPPHRIALCIQMELCDASLSQYIWARNFYMQCESEIQISRLCQQGLREPYIPASVFHAVVKSSNLSTAIPAANALAVPASVSGNNNASPSSVPRQNSGIGLNLMHCIDVTCCLKIIRQILLGIEYIHSRDLVHRDLKPSNIFFKFDGAGSFEPRAMIGDFGLARYISAALDVSDQQVTSSSPTHAPASTGVARQPPVRRLSVGVGTMAYASPEQLSGRSYDSKSDIFSCAIIMFEIIVPFFTVMERNKLLNELRAGRVPPAFRQQYPRLEVLLRSMLNAEPAQRPTASKILQSDVFEDKDYLISNLREKLIEAEMQIEALEKQQQRQMRLAGIRRRVSDSPGLSVNYLTNK